MPKLMYIDYGMNLAEASQRNPIQFALASFDEITDTYTNTIPWIYCRDYLTDALYYKKKGLSKKENIYGFYPDKEQVKDSIILIRNTPSGVIEKNLHHLHNIEEKFGLDKTILVHVEDNVYALHFDERFLLNSLLLAYYTAVIRFLTYRELVTDDPFTELFHALSKGGYCLDVSYLDPTNTIPFKDVNITKLLIDDASVIRQDYFKSTISLHCSGGIFTYCAHPEFFKQEYQ